MMKVLVGLVVALAILAGIGWLGLYVWKTSVEGTQIVLANQLDAKNGPVENALFEMRKVVKTKLKCKDDFADKFIASVAAQANPRGEGGSLIKLNGAESAALGLPQDLYLDLANTIQGQVANFTRQQNELMDIWQTHKTWCQNPWHNKFGLAMAEKVRPQPVMITSQETKDAVASKVMSEDLL
jgi:hypothetical protein